MKILALVEDLRINKTSAGICNSRILMALLLGGHSIKCLYDYYEDNTFPWLKNDNITFLEIHNLKESNVINILKKIPKANALPAYTTGFNFGELRKIKSWKQTIKEELDNNYDFILVLGAGNSNSNFFAIASIKTKVPYIVYYHDPYPIHQYPKPYGKPSSHVGRLKAKKSNKVIEKAYKVSFPSLKLYEWMLKFHPNLADKSFVLPHVYADLTNLPTLFSDTLVNLNEAAFNILHVGSLLGPRNPKTLIKVFNKFINEDEERRQLYFLNIIGSVAKENEEFDKNLDLQNVNLLKTRVSYSKSLDLLKQANAVLILEANSENSPFMPGKLADCIAVRKPIMALTSKNSETARILGVNNQLIADLENEVEIYKILSRLWTSFKDNKEKNLINEELFMYISAENFNKILNEQIKTLDA
ncbi:hypothetical protein JL193_16040 [Polaribacter batillariae]|uniref:Uncharacterized protein n=1 Tax=Polaribacter batillariae TaxID=2808900 RepID=A0ABX7SX52_9FLAO|nr:hypothetical protein [Polaribacter batillariae]QTD37561.1 hypothetical protein JL193_16040 [Polaribacter batillariae]